MMDARAALGDKLRHRAVRIAGLEELDLDVAQRQGDDGGAIGRFRMPRREAEYVSVEGQGGVDRRDGDAHMGDTKGRRGHVAREHYDCTRGSGEVKAEED